ncbi:hypothetical protein CFD26_101931 [Aspergillus turcosus]|uniref:Uncharacterized protein n=1 Tax=Aspergillus turcosus TaxID=1245748 RepID=A0A421CUM9_9EURO|nr:hypothetical protein CFD26_101931 [Aspergillus turcosus]
MDTSPFEEQSDCQNTSVPSPPINTSKPGRPRIERAGETAGEKVAELEQTILAIRDLYLSVHTSVVDSEIFMFYPFLLQSMQTNLRFLLSLTQSVPSRSAEDQPSSTHHSTDGSWDENFLGNKPPLPSPALSSQHPASGPGDAAGSSLDQFALDPLLLCDEYLWEQSNMDMNNDEISICYSM